jgi:hypothetical protein
VPRNWYLRIYLLTIFATVLLEICGVTPKIYLYIHIYICYQSVIIIPLNLQNLPWRWHIFYKWLNDIYRHSINQVVLKTHLSAHLSFFLLTYLNILCHNSRRWTKIEILAKSVATQSEYIVPFLFWPDIVSIDRVPYFQSVASYILKATEFILKVVCHFVTCMSTFTWILHLL